MNRWVHSTSLIFLAVATTLGRPAAGQEDLGLEVVGLSDGSIMLRHLGPQPTNLIALLTEKGIVVIDAGISAEVAQAAREKIQKTFGRTDFAYLINTHDHGDHTYGNQAFADVPIIGHERVPEKMEANEGQRLRTVDQVTRALEPLRARVDSLDPASDQAGSLRETIAFYEILASSLGETFRLTPPTVTFPERKVLDLGDRTLELVYFGKSHSDTDILILCPEEGLLATGDLFAPGIDPYLNSERVPFIRRWLEKLDWALDGERGVRVVAPAHGDLLAKEELSRVRDYLQAQETSLAGKSSAFVSFRESLEKEGIEAALLRMDELKTRSNEFYFFHAEFDSFVYGLMLDDKLEEAIPLFQRLVDHFPEVPNAHDSLGEAYLRAGREEEAAGAFGACLKLDPDHQNARRRLAEIGG